MAYFKHGIDSFRKLSATCLVNATSISPSPFETILIAFPSKIHDLCPAILPLDIGMLAVKLLQRYLLSTPCVRKNDVWRLLEVHEFYEVQGVEVEKTHLVREAGSLANSDHEIRCDCGCDEGTEQKRLC